MKTRIEKEKRWRDLERVRRCFWRGVMFACVMLSSTGAVDAEELRYTVTNHVGSALGAAKINDKGQVVWQSGTSWFLDLPAPDYGLPAGRHGVANVGRDPRIFGFNNQGLIIGYDFWNKQGVLTDGLNELFYPVDVNDEDMMVGEYPPAENNRRAAALRTGDGEFFVAQNFLGKANFTDYFFFGITNSGLILGERRDRETVLGPETRSWFVASTKTGGTVSVLPQMNVLHEYVDLNEKGQLTWGEDLGGTFGIYLPEADYGLSAGLRVLGGFPSGAGVGGFIRFSNLGVVAYGSETQFQFWRAGEHFRLEDRLVPGSGTVVVQRVLAISKDGVVLANGTRDGVPRLMRFTPVLTEPELEIQLDPGKELRPGEEFAATVVVNHLGTASATYAFRGPIVSADPETHVEIGEVQEPEPFVLSAAEKKASFTVPCKAEGLGFFTLSTTLDVTEETGAVRTITAEVEVLVKPLSLEITITNERHQLNQTPESKWGARAKAINADQRANGLTPYGNLVEIEMKVKNEGTEVIENVNVPTATTVLRSIQTTDLAQPGVPLTPIRLYAPGGLEVDLTESTDDDPLDGVTLQPGEEAVFAWVLDAFDANPDPEEDDSQDLEFTPLVLGSLRGRNVVARGEAELHVIDRPLLEWGIRPKEGRTSYSSSQVVGVEGYIENISTRNGRPPQDIRVMLFQKPEGNLGGGFMYDPITQGTATKTEYAVFDLPATGPGSSMNLAAAFRSLATPEASSGKVRYWARLWTVDDEGGGTETVEEATEQAILKEGWMEEYDVTFAANRAEFTREEECENLTGNALSQVGLSPFLCGAVSGLTIDFTDGIIGLSSFMFDSSKLMLDAGVSFQAYKHQMMRNLWKAVSGDPVAKQALLFEIYVQYETFVNLGVMAKDTTTGLPMTFAEFADMAEKELNKFFDDVQKGGLDELQFKIGKFLGANPDLALEPLMVASAYMKMNKALVTLDRTLTSDLIKAADEAENLRKANKLDDRLNDAAKAKRGPETALLPGDVLSSNRMFDIFGVSRKQLEAIQKIAFDNKVIISLRSRNPISVKLLQRGEAYPKPQALKAKCVSKIDIQYLGYRESAFGKLELVEPRPGLLGPDGRALSGEALETALNAEMDLIRTSLKGDEVLEAEIRGRMQVRAEEWNKCFLDKLKDGVKPGAIEVEVRVDFEAELQFTQGRQRKNLEAVGQVNDVRKVTYEPVPGSNPRVWEVKMSGPKGGPAKAVTGDIDVMAILDETGGLIRDPQKRIEVYKQLAAALDMQHGESYSFFLNNARKEYLKDHVFGKPGAEAMVTVSGFGDLQPRASYFVDNLSVIDNPGAPNLRYLPRRKKTPQSLVDFILRPGQAKEVRRVDPSGEYMLLDGAVVKSRPPLDLVSRFTPTTISEALEEFFRLNPYVVPSLLARVFYAGAKPEFTRESEGKILQGFDSNGEFVQREWTEANGWQDVPNPAPRSGRNGGGGGGTGPTELLLAPMSALTEPVSAGAVKLEILDQVALQTPGAFFQVGDRVVINPGGANQEIRVVGALGSLILTEALQFDHEQGEMVAMLPPLGPTVSLVGLPEGGEVNGRTGLELRVNAGSRTSTITRVEFYIGGALIGESTGPNFRLPWLPLANGDHQIKAVAHDDNGQQAESETITVKVNHIGTFDGPIKGSYSGLLRDEPATQPFCGTATMTTTAVGGYSLQVVMGGRSYRVKGVFDAEGTALAELNRPRPQTPLRVRLTASTAPLVDQVLGVITDGEFNGPAITGDSFATTFTLDRLVWHPRSNPAPQAGPYTVVMPADDFALALGAPLGDGTATLSVTTAGRARMACKLADGTGATVSCLLSKDGRLPLFAALYNKKGMLSGWFQFQSLPNISDGAARIDWVRPSDPKAKQFQSGFTVQANLLASAYAPPPANVRMIPLVNVGGNLTAIFEGGDLTIPLERLATMDGGSRVVVPMQGAEGLTIKSVSKTGMVSGNFWHPETGAKTAFTGMMFQKQDMIAGSFLAGPQGGGFTFEANPSWEVTGADALPLGSRLPKLAIRSPRARQVLPAGLGEVSVSGTASHSSGITGVYWQLLKDGVLTEPAAATGTTNWSFPIPLAAGEGGLFTVFARANSVSGEQSNVVTSEFRVMKLADLEVLVTGPGSVSKGFLGTSSREVGRLYKLTASPLRGKRFLGWSGSLTSSSRTLSFLMQEGLVLHAYFGD